MSWADAHRIAAIAAAHAHRDYGVDVTAPPVDVAAALASADVPVMWRPMPRLFGAYLCGPALRPGVLVNSAIPVGARRHTAAHELGHHCLGHAAAIDDGACLHLDPLESDAAAVPNGRVRWTEAEKTAEAFAAWFLMPRPAVSAALDRLGLARLDTPTDVYRLSLLLGTSYRSTVRHLTHLRLCSPGRASSWLGQVPGRLKAKLHPTGRWDHRGSADVWNVDGGFGGARIHLQPGDDLVAQIEPGLHANLSGDPCLLPCRPRSDPDGTSGSHISRIAWTATNAGGARDARATLAAVAEGGPRAADRTVWSVEVVVEAAPDGLDRHWLARAESTR